jgi:hypothetical protein
LDATDDADITGYKRLLSSPSPNPEKQLTVSCGTVGQDVPVASFVSDVGQPGVTDFPAGTASRRFWVHLNQGTVKLHLLIYARATNGTETLQRDEFSPEFSDKTVTLVNWMTTVLSAYPINATDRIVLKLYAQKISGSGTLQVTVHFEGSSAASQIQTTISAGAQGPQGPAGPTGPGVATGGTVDQLLAKNSGANYDTKWVNAPSGGGSGGHTIQDEGSALTARTGLNFIGAGVTASDDAANNRTLVVIPGSSASTSELQFQETFSGDLTAYTFDTGTGTWTIQSGVLVPQSVAEKVLYRTGLVMGDSFKAKLLIAALGAGNPAFDYGVIWKRSDANNYLLGQLINSPTQGLRLFEKRGGTFNSLATVNFTVPTPVVGGTPLTLIVRQQLDSIILEAWAWDRTRDPSGQPMGTLTFVLSGAPKTAFGAGTSGNVGLRTAPPSATTTTSGIDEFVVAKPIASTGNPQDF